MSLLCVRIEGVKLLSQAVPVSRCIPHGLQAASLSLSTGNGYRAGSPCRSVFHGRPSQQVRILLTSASSLHLRASRIDPFALKTFVTAESPLASARSTVKVAMSTTTHIRSHGGKSHGHAHHHHHHDNTYLVSTNKKDAGVRITRIGLFVNLGMAVGKGAGGWIFNSQALLADAVHALTDLFSDFMTLATVAWSIKPPNERFPSGYGKLESLGSLGVSGLLLTGGLWMCFSACNIVYAQVFLDAAAAVEHVAHAHHGHSHSHSAAEMLPDIKAAWLAAGSIVIKEWLYRATMKVARERKSSILASNAVHHRVDSLTGVVAFVAIAGTHLFHGATWLDPVGGLLVSLMVIKAGWSNTRAALIELADIAVDDETKESVRKAALAGLVSDSANGISAITGGADVDVREVQGLKSGPNYLMEIELAVPGTRTVDELQQVENAVRQQVGAQVRGVKRVKVRFVPKERDPTDFADEFISADVSAGDTPEAQASRHELPNGSKNGNGTTKRRL
ncbi:MAG: hypothetical protein M1825_001246 [Sarcosagium campestre]|nr:MAG: hypothetical protein M1825_001246 [Sarcosagium campestre]